MKGVWLIAGGRDFNDYRFAVDFLDNLVKERGAPKKIVNGGAKGADAISAKWAAFHGYTCEVHHANWQEEGKSAGPIRNRRMLQFGKPELIIAFEGGPGTANMVTQAVLAGLEVLQPVRPENTLNRGVDNSPRAVRKRGRLTVRRSNEAPEPAAT